jgi:hypothetical protein
VDDLAVLARRLGGVMARCVDCGKPIGEGSRCDECGQIAIADYEMLGDDANYWRTIGTADEIGNK